MTRRSSAERRGRHSRVCGPCCSDDRSQAVIALGGIDDPAATGALDEALGDDESAVRRAAKKALTKR
ncbi:MAG TPA: HEAT repeat domain-containing protein [Thermoleophilia bacterium]|nr:HEAT repeat domain-containing protein [Thermoleophilia bacterium]